MKKEIKAIIDLKNKFKKLSFELFNKVTSYKKFAIQKK
jgi:hypothetical protein